MTKNYTKSYIMETVKSGRVAWVANATLQTMVQALADKTRRGHPTYIVRTLGNLRNGGYGVTDQLVGLTLSQAVEAFRRWEDTNAI